MICVLWKKSLRAHIQEDIFVWLQENNIDCWGFSAPYLVGRQRGTGYGQAFPSSITLHSSHRSAAKHLVHVWHPGKGLYTSNALFVETNRKKKYFLNCWLDTCILLRMWISQDEKATPLLFRSRSIDQNKHIIQSQLPCGTNVTSPQQQHPRQQWLTGSLSVSPSTKRCSTNATQILKTTMCVPICQQWQLLD